MSLRVKQFLMRSFSEGLLLSPSQMGLVYSPDSRS